MRFDRIRIPDWRDDAAYARLLGAERIGFAWEWLRRDPDYRSAAIAALGAGRMGPLQGQSPERWGLHVYENPGLDALQARPLWTAAAYPAVLAADALPAQKRSSAFVLGRYKALSRMHRGADGREHLSLGDGRWLVRLDIESGSVAHGPVHLRFRLNGPGTLEHQLPALERLAVLLRTGAFPSRSAPSGAVRRWVLAIRAADALAAGATQRDIAQALLGLDAAQPRWRSEAPNVRGKAQRLVQQARALASSGYARFLA